MALLGSHLIRAFLGQPPPGQPHLPPTRRTDSRTGFAYGSDFTLSHSFDTDYPFTISVGQSGGRTFTTTIAVTATPSIATASAGSTDGADSQRQNGSSESMSTGAIVGIAAGAIGAILALSALLIFFCWRRRRQRQKTLLQEGKLGEEEHDEGSPQTLFSRYPQYEHYQQYQQSQHQHARDASPDDEQRRPQNQRRQEEQNPANVPWYPNVVMFPKTTSVVSLAGLVRDDPPTYEETQHGRPARTTVGRSSPTPASSSSSPPVASNGESVSASVADVAAAGAVTDGFHEYQFRPRLDEGTKLGP